jgi:hypothetical protein
VGDRTFYEAHFLNNELRTVVDIDDRRIVFDKGEIVRNGAALHIDQGVAVTSHARPDQDSRPSHCQHPGSLVQSGERSAVLRLGVACTFPDEYLHRQQDSFARCCD